MGHKKSLRSTELSSNNKLKILIKLGIINLHTLINEACNFQRYRLINNYSNWQSNLANFTLPAEKLKMNEFLLYSISIDYERLYYESL